MDWLKKMRRRGTTGGNQRPGELGSESAETLRKSGLGGQDTVLRPVEPVAPGAVFPAEAQTPISSFAAGDRFGVGELVADTYAIRRLLGKGAMGVVYLAHQTQWDQEVALKVPQHSASADQEHRRRIVRESEAWTDLGLHPHIAYCYYVHSVNDMLLLVVEYVDGGNLRDWITDGRCADLRTGLDLAIQFCHGLEHAHAKRLIHRDIKPENILLTQDGTLKVTDFGIVSVAGKRPAVASQGLSRSVSVIAQLDAGSTLGWGIGTPGYMAPEQWVGTRPVNERSDLFGLGVCLYEMFCGRSPYEGRTDHEWQRWALDPQQKPWDPQEARGGNVLPVRLSVLMQRCVDWDSERRAASVAEVRRDLCAIYEEGFHEPSSWAELPSVSLEAGGLNNRALSYLALGRIAETEQAWEAALSAAPHHPEATFNRSVHLWRKSEITDDAVVRKLREVAASHEANWLPWYLLCQVHLERDDCDAALSALAQIPDADAKQAEVDEARALAQERAPTAMRALGTLEGHTDIVMAVRLSSDGQLALSGSADHTLRAWNVATRQCLRTFEGHSGSVNCLDLSADGRLALSGGNDRTLRLWDVSAGQCLKTFEAHETEVWAVCLDRNGRWVLSAGRNDVRLWDLTTGRCLRSFQSLLNADHRDRVAGLGLSTDRNIAIVGTLRGALRTYELSSGNVLRLIESPGEIESVCLSDDGRLVFAGANDGTLKAWSVADGSCVRTLAHGHLSMGRFSGVQCDVTSDGNRALSTTSDGAVRLWDLASGRCLRTFDGGRQHISTLSISGDGRIAITGGTDKTIGAHSGHGSIVLYDVSGNGQKPLAPFRVSRPVGSSVAAVAAETYRHNMDRAALALNGGDSNTALHHLRAARSQPGYARRPEATEMWSALYRRMKRTALKAVWEMRTIKAHPIEAHPTGIRSMCLTRDGTRALTGSEDGTLKLWDVATGACLRSIEDHGSILHSVSISPDGSLALSTRVDAMLKLWALSDGACQTVYQHPNSPYAGCFNPVYSGCFNPDGSLILSGCDDGALRLWEVATGRCLRTFEGDVDDSVVSISFSADGMLALAGYEGTTAKLWEVSTGRRLSTFEGHYDAVGAVCLSADG